MVSANFSVGSTHINPFGNITELSSLVAPPSKPVGIVYSEDAIVLLLTVRLILKVIGLYFSWLGL